MLVVGERSTVDCVDHCTVINDGDEMCDFAFRPVKLDCGDERSALTVVGAGGHDRVDVTELHWRR